jgi:hypothetical protein
MRRLDGLAMVNPEIMTRYNRFGFIFECAGRFVTNNARFMWSADGESGATAKMTLDQNGLLTTSKLKVDQVSTDQINLNLWTIKPDGNNLIFTGPKNKFVLQGDGNMVSYCPSGAVSGAFNASWRTC